jgi:hypothetical protein
MIPTIFQRLYPLEEEPQVGIELKRSAEEKNAFPHLEIEPWSSNPVTSKFTEGAHLIDPVKDIYIFC